MQSSTICTVATGASLKEALVCNNALSVRGGADKIGKGKVGGKAATKKRQQEAGYISKSIFKKVLHFISKYFGLGNKTYATGKKEKKSGATSSKASASTSITDNSNARIQKELRSFMINPPDGCKVAVGSNIRSWVVTITGAKGTIFAGEEYKLRMLFPKEYPSKPPSVYFLKPTPKHQHVYTNGDICLNLLGRDWRPTMTGQMLAISILSMLSSAKEKKLPEDNAMHAETPPGLKQENWFYHDDRC